jgi:hypothetical protein
VEGTTVAKINILNWYLVEKIHEKVGEMIHLDANGTFTKHYAARVST